MYFQQFYLGCLAHASYMIGNEGVAVVVDPQRDVDLYIDAAASEGLRITHVIETHLHADFVSGHVELAGRTGAEIWIGEKAGAEFPHVPVREGDELHLGKDVFLRALETPGHTPESVCWLVFDRSASENPLKILTGDTLFIGDVGRPDLAGSRGYTPREMAGMMYDSLHEKILCLPDEVEVHPAHGAGSACGRNISRERSSTIGIQRRTNYALQIGSREEFIETLTADLAPPPRYFPVDAEINRRGAGRLTELALTDLSAGEVERLVRTGAVVLDVRDPRSYGERHIPGAIHIGLGGEYASWAGTLLEISSRIVLVAADRTRAEEAQMRLARVGIESVEGWLEGGLDAWTAAGGKTAEIGQIPIERLRTAIEQAEEFQVIDVRREGEFAAGHVPGAINIPLHLLGEREVKLDRTTFVICESGYRSSIAASILESRGAGELCNVSGGTSAWRKAGYPLEEESERRVG
jgi:hydroxyacylglutathione hydrolase